MHDKLDIKPNNQEIKVPAFIAIESNLGAATLLASKSPSHKYLFASDFEWLIIAPIALKQAQVMRSEKKEPIAFISWAKVSKEVEERIVSGNVKLTPRDWNSGDKLFIIDIIAPFGGTKQILSQLLEGRLKDEDVNILRPKKEGKGFEVRKAKDVVAEEFSKNDNAQINNQKNQAVN